MHFINRSNTHSMTEISLAVNECSMNFQPTEHEINMNHIPFGPYSKTQEFNEGVAFNCKSNKITNIDNSITVTQKTWISVTTIDIFMSTMKGDIVTMMSAFNLWKEDAYN